MTEHNWVLTGHDYDIDKWYASVAHLTPKTFFIELNAIQMKAIIAFYQLEFLGRKSNIIEVQRELRSIADSVQKILNQDTSIRSWFVRLSCRSPKDGIPYNDQRGESLINLAKKHQIVMDDLDTTVSTSANSFLVDLFELDGKSLEIFTAEQAIHLLCTSERINRDLTAALDVGMTSKLALRAYDENINHTWEFRCFIRSRSLVAISQYNPYVMIDHLRSLEPEITRAIQSFFTSERHNFPFENFVMDVCLVPQPPQNDAASQPSPRVNGSEGNDAYRVVLIEINPYDRCTGAALFDWDRDSDILLEPSDAGSVVAPCVRLREGPLPEAGALASVMVEEIKASARGLRHLDLIRRPQEAEKRCSMS